MKYLIYYIFIFFTLFLTSCGSGEFEREDIEITVTEKIPVYDTVKSITEINEEIKKDLTTDNEIKKDLYTYTVQIGAYIVPENFDRFYNKAKSVLGEGVYYKQMDNLYKIRIGSFDLKADAINYMDKLQRMGFTDAFVVTTKR